jgi:hypothetical protein
MGGDGGELLDQPFHAHDARVATGVVGANKRMKAAVPWPGSARASGPASGPASGHAAIRLRIRPSGHRYAPAIVH